VQERRPGGGGGGSCCGVFVGILALVATVISVTVSLLLSIIAVIELAQLALSLAACLASLVTATVHLRRCVSSHAPRNVLLDLLLLTSVTSVLAMASFDAVAAHHAGHQTSLVVSVVVVVQSVLQTGTVAVAMRRRVSSRTKLCSWRQTVALLMACNAAMWLIEVIRCAGLTTQHRPHALAVYSQLTYTSIVQVCAPVAIFHRFITVLCLLVMWKQTAVRSTTVL